MSRTKMDESLADTARTAVSDAAERVKDAGSEAAAEASRLGKSVVDEAGELAASMSEKLKSVGIDPDVMTAAAKDQASELQKLVAEELRTRPFRALGLAAAAGLVLGFLSTR